MSIDVERLRRHYASLSDEGLLEINREELVDAARTLLDDEIASRGLLEDGDAFIEAEAGEGADGEAWEPAEAGMQAGIQVDEDWIEEAATAFSCPADPNDSRSEDMTHAYTALEAAGIPHHVVVREAEAGGPNWVELLVPGKLVLEATSILDRDVFNAQLEDGWRDHFASLTDEELDGVDIELLTAGWADRIERLTRAYREERAGRGA